MHGTKMREYDDRHNSMNPNNSMSDNQDLDEDFIVDFGDDFDSIMDDELGGIDGGELYDHSEYEEFEEFDDIEMVQDSQDDYNPNEQEYFAESKPSKMDKILNVILSVGGTVIGVLAVVLIVIIWDGTQNDGIKTTKQKKTSEKVEQTSSTEKEIITMFDEPDAIQDTDISTFYADQLASEEESYSQWVETSDSNESSGEEETTTSTDESQSDEETDVTDSETEETTPVETTPEETTPAETTPEETTTPAETTPQETTPQETTPQETTPQETTPQETTPQETTPAETTPQETADTTAAVQ